MDVGEARKGLVLVYVHPDGGPGTSGPREAEDDPRTVLESEADPLQSETN